PSPDDGAGVVSVPFTLSGVGVAKWALNMPDPTDLDIYLFGPGGTLVGASTNGGTHESILLNSPADGTYTMVIHGWSVGVTPLQFDLRSWLVPAADGAGSLTVSSGASTTATIGGTSTVGITWAGLTAGEEYLGSVTHRNGTTVVGRTVVAVTG
ncbi:MAG TPA: hypothetical protein PLS37_12260, partial [Propioniciclava tarda]|nr:hypothetical protein [Propioniciclava tarda]